MPRLRLVILLAPIVLILSLFLLLPIAHVLKVGFYGIADQTGSGTFTLEYFAAVFRDRELSHGLLNSAGIALGVTLTCVLIAVPLAMLSVRYDFAGKSLVSGLLLVPLILPPFVGAIGMRQLLGRFGALTALAHHLGAVGPDASVDWIGRLRIIGIILVEALALYPIVYLNVSAALANLDPALEQAAANLGASRWTIFRRITLPLMRPGLFAGATIVLIWSFTELGTPLMFDYYRVTSVQVFHRISQVSGNPVPYALIIIMLMVSMLLYLLGKFVLGKRFDAAVTKASVQSSPRVLGPGAGMLALLPFAIVIALALLPHISVILMSIAGVGTWYDSLVPRVFTATHFIGGLTHPATLPSVRNSIVFSFLSTALDLLIGISIAWLLVRSNLPRAIKQLIDAAAMLPLAVPGLVLAFGYLAISVWLQTHRSPGISPWVDATWSKIVASIDVVQNPTVLLVIAYAMRRLPYVVRSAVAGLEQTPVDLELAARNLGASSARTMWRITVPLISANLLAGAVLAFAFAMLEVSDSLILAQKEEYWPITKAIYELWQRPGDGPYIASALGVWAMVLLTLALLSVSSLLGRRLGAIFRV